MSCPFPSPLKGANSAPLIPLAGFKEPLENVEKRVKWKELKKGKERKGRTHKRDGIKHSQNKFLFTALEVCVAVCRRVEPSFV